MAFLLEFISFVETDLITIFDSMYLFFNTGVITLLSKLPGIFGDLLGYIAKLFPNTDVVMWKFMLYNFGTILVLHFIGLIWKSLPIL